jgi:hypothetical protein
VPFQWVTTDSNKIFPPSPIWRPSAPCSTLIATDQAGFNPAKGKCITQISAFSKELQFPIASKLGPSGAWQAPRLRELYEPGVRRRPYTICADTLDQPQPSIRPSPSSPPAARPGRSSRPVSRCSVGCQARVREPIPRD